jgi:hypothetical protein
VLFKCDCGYSVMPDHALINGIVREGVFEFAVERVGACLGGRLRGHDGVCRVRWVNETARRSTRGSTRWSNRSPRPNSSDHTSSHRPPHKHQSPAPLWADGAHSCVARLLSATAELHLRANARSRFQLFGETPPADQNSETNQCPVNHPAIEGHSPASIAVFAEALVACCGAFDPRSRQFGLAATSF